MKWFHFFLFFIFFFAGKAEINVIKTCALHASEQLRACPREHRAVVLQAISPISMKLYKFKGSTPKLKNTNWFLFWFFPGGHRPLPGFLGFHKGSRLKIDKMYEALPAMVFNQLL